MKKKMYLLGSLLIILLSCNAFLHAQQWTIGSNFEIKFTSDDPSGVFTNLEGDILFDKNDLDNSKFVVSIDVSSINTGNGMQNRHALSEKWFDAEKYPKIKFVSKEISKAKNGYKVKGILTIKGIEKELEFPFTFKEDENGGLLEGSFMVNRNDFGIGRPGGKASEKINLDIKVPVTK